MTDYELFIIARWAYSVGEEFISDVEYSTLEKDLKAKMPDDPYVNRPWSLDPCPTELLEKYGLERLKKHIKLSSNAESIPALTTEEELINMFSTLSSKSRLSFKIDGWHMCVHYYNGKYVSANTRGRTGTSKEAEVMKFIVPQEIPYKGRVMISGEVSMPNDRWELFKLKTGATAQRASVSTAIANADAENIKMLAFAIDADEDIPETADRYVLLRNMGFSTPYSVWVNDYEQLLKGIELMSRRSVSYNYLTDGLVIENPSIQYAIRLGAWKEEVLCSYVTGYSEKPGMYGVSEVLKIRPVEVKGNVRSQVNITNLQQIINNNLQIGLPVAFNVRSSANAVIDVTNTRRLQKEWYSRYEDYRKKIDKESVQ